MEEPNPTEQLPDTPLEEVDSQPEAEVAQADDATIDKRPAEEEADGELSALEVTPAADDESKEAPDSESADKQETEDADASTDSIDKLIHDGYEEETSAEELASGDAGQHSEEHDQDEQPEGTADEEASQSADDSVLEPSELDYTTTDTEDLDDNMSSVAESVDLQRRHSVRTEALIQAAARAVVSMRQHGGGEVVAEEADESKASSTTGDGTDADETLQLDEDTATVSRPDSAASNSLRSPAAESSVGDGAYSSSHHGTDDDVFSDRSPRSSIHSGEDHCDDESNEQMTEKGSDSPQVRSRVTSGASVSAASVVSDYSRLSRYEKESFVPTSRNNRPAFRSPESVRAMQMSSPTPSVFSSSNQTPKRASGFPTISRLGSPAVSAQYPPKGHPSPSRFKKQEAPLVLLHVTLLPLRWPYGDLLDHFEAKKSTPMAFSGEGMKNLRSAWRQVQDRLGDTVLERGILLPHPQSDYEILEERLLEALELPLRRRARILECGHYLGPSNETVVTDDVESDSEDISDAEEFDVGRKQEKRHWCKTCRGDIKFEELGSERVFRIKVYASNGLMSPGAWEACWKEMERVDIEVEPIIDSCIQSDLAKLSAAMDHEHQQRLEDEQNQQMEDEERLQVETAQRLALEQERQNLEAQRQQFEEERRQAMEEAQRKLEEERRKFEEEQRQRLEEERRQKFEEDRQLLEAQRQEFEEQRLALEEQKKLIEDEQRQHIEEARRQELEVEHKILDEQRQELEDARQQFEEEQRQMAAPRSTSRTSYVEDEIIPTSRDGATSAEFSRSQRESDRLREIYGQSRSPSEALLNGSSPAIHIHVDSKRQQEEEQNSRQLATIPAPRESGMHTGPIHEARHPDSYIPPPSPQSPAEQAYQRREDRRRPLDSASLPELLGETIRVLLQDPKNVAIAVLVVALAMLAGQYGKGPERGVEIYKPSHPEPVGQVIMNTPPAIQQAQPSWSTPSPETVYKTVTAEAPQKPSPTPEVEVIYRTVTQQPQQESPTRVVETIYSVVTATVEAPPAQAKIEPPEEASELPPSDADPSVDLERANLDSIDGEHIVEIIPAPPFTPVGAYLFTCPLFPLDSGLDSDDRTSKIDASEEAEFEVVLQDLEKPSFMASSALNHEGLSSVSSSGLSIEPTGLTESDTSLSTISKTMTSTSSRTSTASAVETVTEELPEAEEDPDHPGEGDLRVRWDEEEIDSDGLETAQGLVGFSYDMYSKAERLAATALFSAETSCPAV